MTPEELAYQAELERQERIKRRHRELRGELLKIQNKLSSLKTNINNLEENIENLIMIDDKIYNVEKFEKIKSETNNIFNDLGSTISRVNKEC